MLHWISKWYSLYTIISKPIQDIFINLINENKLQEKQKSNELSDVEKLRYSNWMKERSMGEYIFVKSNISLKYFIIDPLFSLQVTALLALSEGAQFLSNGLLYVTERLRLGPRGATSLVVRLLVTTPGLKNMTG